MKRDKGSSIVEFALILPVFFLLVFAIIDYGLLYWANLTMQYAVREGTRYAITGQANLDPNASNQQRYLAVVHKMEDSSMGLWQTTKPSIAVSINGGSFSVYGNVASYTPGMFGGQNDIVAIRLDCHWPILSPWAGTFVNGTKYEFSVGATMRNETYS